MLPEEPPDLDRDQDSDLVIVWFARVYMELNTPLLPVYRRRRRRRLSDHDSGTYGTNGSWLEELLGAVREQNQGPLMGC